MSRVLVIAYYFPPMGLSGVQRISKLVKYLPQHGWQPTVLTVEPGAYFAYDDSLMREIEERGIEIVRTKSLDPTRVLKRKVVSIPGPSSHTFLSSISQFFFIPDNKIGWKRYALATGKALLGEKKYDAILSSAPPYTAHLIGRELSEFAGVPLFCDFRDDWLDNPRHKYWTPFHRAAHRRMERGVVSACSHVTAINRRIKENIIQRNLGAEGYHTVTVIPHGFDPEDFEKPPADRSAGKLRFLYSGIFYDAQVPDHFLRGLRRFLDHHPYMSDFVEAVFVGLVPESAKSLIHSLGLDSHVLLAGYLPHDEAVRMLCSADVLWMTVGKQAGGDMICTSKLYEYIGSRKPILGLVPDGTARQTLERYGAALVVEPDDVDAIAGAISQLADAWRNDSLTIPDEEFVRQFDRYRIAGEVAKIMHEALSFQR